MASKQVAARAKSSTFVVAAANTHADAIQTGAKELLGPHLKKGEKLPDFAFLSQLLARTLEDFHEVVADPPDVADQRGALEAGAPQH